MSGFEISNEDHELDLMYKALDKLRAENDQLRSELEAERGKVDGYKIALSCAKEEITQLENIVHELRRTE